ncbi:hypothetical protein KKA95_04605 [Patescibacteria group bacterium]|nr:hypothetical protein [Patescibacteria group bacterium]
MADPELKIPTTKDAEASLTRKHPEIFDRFDILRIRAAIEQVIRKISSLHTEEPDDDGEKERDTWNVDVIDDAFSGKVLEILESDQKLTEMIKQAFYFALTEGHIDRARQLRSACPGISFRDEIVDAFKDAYAYNKKYLLREIAQFDPRLSYEDLLAELNRKADEAERA